MNNIRIDFNVLSKYFDFQISFWVDSSTHMHLFNRWRESAERWFVHIANAHLMHRCIDLCRFAIVRTNVWKNLNIMLLNENWAFYSMNAIRHKPISIIRMSKISFVHKIEFRTYLLLNFKHNHLNWSELRICLCRLMIIPKC